MRSPLRMVVGVSIVWMLTGCSTPGRRAHERPTAFHGLPVTDQQTVLHGEVHAGMPRDAVYIAWGKPDRITQGGKGNETSETWLYERRLTISEPFGSNDQYGPFHGLGNPPVPLWVRPEYAFRGIGGEGPLIFQPHVRVIDVRYQRAEFANGKLTRFVDRRDGRLTLFPP